MAGGAQLMFNLLGATAPLQSNPAFGAVEHTPDDMLAHINDNLPTEQEPYETADEARKDGYKIPQTSLWMNPKTGEDVTSYVNNSSYGNNPYKTPGFWQRFVNPEAASREAEGNAAFQQAPGLATQAEDIRKNVIGGRLSQQPSFMNPQNLSTTERYSMNEGNMSPSELNNANVATGVAAGGGIQPQVGSDIATAQRNLQMTQGALGRTPAENAALDQQIVNQLHAETNVEPLKIQSAINELRSQLNRQPTIEEAKDYIAKGGLAEAKVGAGIAETKLTNQDIIDKTFGNNLMSEYANSMFNQPPGSPIATTYQRDPLGNLQFNTGYDPRFVPTTQTMAAGLRSAPIARDKNGNVIPTPQLRSGTLGDITPSVGSSLKKYSTTDNEDNFNKILNTPVNSLVSPKNSSDEKGDISGMGLLGSSLKKLFSGANASSGKPIITHDKQGNPVILLNGNQTIPYTKEKWEELNANH